MRKVLTYLALIVVGMLLWQVYFFVRTKEVSFSETEISLQNNLCEPLVSTVLNKDLQEYWDEKHNITFSYPTTYTLCTPRRVLCPSTTPQKVCDDILEKTERERGVNFLFKLID